jgi:5'-nucleotidase (lipoprotein e(P4) family)
MAFTGRRLLPVATVVLVLVSGCRSGRDQQPATPSAAPAVARQPAVTQAGAAIAAGQESLSITWVRRSAEYQALLLQAYGLATTRVEQAAAARQRGSWAVVLDADETVISNLEYQAERERTGQGFSQASWSAWVARREATPLPGAAAFLARVRSLGGRIAIVTNRLASECADTEAVFRAHALAFDVMLCKPDKGPSDKTPRFDAVKNGATPAGLPPLEIVAFLGDNIQDFPGMTQAVRQRGPEALAEVGVRFFVLPNPMYGSWQ